MEVTAGRGGTLPVPASSSLPLRKEWRAVSDERTIYEEGAEPIERVAMSEELLQQRLQEISQQREELQHVEIEMRAQIMIRAGLRDLQSSFLSQIKEQADAASQLKEKLHDREKHMHELEMKLEEKDRELRAIKIDHEAAWVKDDLLREQNKELTTFRRERDNSDAERAQHLKQIDNLQAHIQEKESQFLTLEEEHRVAQKTILYKDEQLREAQAWITRAQEMDALHSTTNQSLQAEIRERAEQFTQYYFGLQRQCAEMERHHLQVIQQLQLELAEAKERNGAYRDGSNVAHESSADSSSHAENKGNQINVNAGAPNGNLCVISNEKSNGHPSFVASSNAPTKTELPAGVAVVPSSILGMGTFLPPGQIAALHPFVMHPQGVPQISLSSSPILQSHVGHFQSMSTIPGQQHWQNQQTAADILQNLKQNTYQPSQTEQNAARPDAPYSYELPDERKVVHPDHFNMHSNQQPKSSSPSHVSTEEVQLLESNGKLYQVSQEPQEKSHANVPFHSTIAYAPSEQNSEIKGQDQNTISAIGQSQDQVIPVEQWPSSAVPTSAAPTRTANSNSVSECKEKMVTFPESATRTTSSMMHGKTTECMLLDERSLLACIVRAIPAGAEGRIRISTTLPNRLGKMIAPLHWQDYKKRYGKLDDFVAHHPELFVIEGDFIHLCEGAQEIISATTAFAKVAAAAAASSAPYSSSFPSVALTPVAQSNRPKRGPSVDSKHAATVSFSEAAITRPGDSFGRGSQIHRSYNQQQNGVKIDIVKGLSNVNISTKSKNLQEPSDISSEMRPANSSLNVAVGNGANQGLSNGRLVSGGKHQARSAAVGIISRR